MGYMTVVSILNDAWPTIKENPEQFMKNISEGMENYHGSAVQHYPVSNYANLMEVHRSFHANLNKVLVVGGNHMEDLSELNPMRYNDDFYLAYKMRMANLAEDMAKSAKLEVLDCAATMIANDMVRAGKNVSEIKETAKMYDVCKALSEEELNKLIWMIGCAMAKE